MRQAQTAVLEKNTTFTADFQTEPFEAAWAGEARWFVQTLRAAGADTELTLTTQISPDGLTWCDADLPATTVRGTGLVSWPIREFGQWLRLRGSLCGDEASVTVRIYLAAKS